MPQCDLETLRTEETIIIHLLYRRSGKRILMVPYGLMHSESTEAEVDNNFRITLKIAADVKLPLSLRHTAGFMWRGKRASQKHSSFSSPCTRGHILLFQPKDWVLPLNWLSLAQCLCIRTSEWIQRVSAWRGWYKLKLNMFFISLSSWLHWLNFILQNCPPTLPSQSHQTEQEHWSWEYWTQGRKCYKL